MEPGLEKLDWGEPAVCAPLPVPVVWGDGLLVDGDGGWEGLGGAVDGDGN